MTDAERVPTVIDVLAAQAMVAAAKKLGCDLEPEVFRDAEWPLSKARPNRRPGPG